MNALLDGHFRKPNKHRLREAGGNVDLHFNRHGVDADQCEGIQFGEHEPTTPEQAGPITEHRGVEIVPAKVTDALRDRNLQLRCDVFSGAVFFSWNSFAATSFPINAEASAPGFRRTIFARQEV